MLKTLILIYNIITISCIKEWWEDSSAIDLTTTNIYKYIGKDKYVIVEFFTKWCFYCKLLFPEYEKIYNDNKRFTDLRKITAEIKKKRRFNLPF